MRRPVLLLFLAILASGLSAQDATTHLRALLERVTTAGSYHAVARVDLVGTGNKVLSSETMEVYSKGSSHWSHAGGRTTVVTEHEFILVDAGEKRIVLQRREASAVRPPAATDLAAQIAAMLKEHADKLSILAEDGRTITLRIAGAPGDDYVNTDLVLRKRDHVLERINYHVQGPSRDMGKGRTLDRIEVVYTVFEVDREIPAARFSTRGYVRTGRDGKAVAAPGYEGYELINYSGS